jgi:hypothetical protein
MTTIQIASTIAVVTGLAGLVPQIWAMTSTRSSSGQSPTGWSLGIGVNALMAYVNLVAYHAVGLAFGNAMGMLLCSVALGAVLRFRQSQIVEEEDRALMAAPDFAGEPAPDATVPTAVRPAGTADAIALSELPTGQFWTIKQEIEQEEARRVERGCPEMLAVAA